MNKDYTPAASTNIEKAWREKYGYVPASEQPAIAAKQAMFKQYGRDISKEASK
jgi:hypothetical protein